MKARPLHRSPLLWLGLLSGCFVLMMWADSYRYASNALVRLGGGVLHCGQETSLVRAEFTTGSYAASGRTGFGRPKLYIDDRPLDLFPMPHLGKGKLVNYPGSTRWFMEIPHWVILLLYLMLMAVLLLWRAIRIRRRDGLTNAE
jgi:hypothetical protein